MRPLYPGTLNCTYLCVLDSKGVPFGSPGICLGEISGRSFRFRNRCCLCRIASGLPGSRTKYGPGGPPVPPCPVRSFRSSGAFGRRGVGGAPPGHYMGATPVEVKTSFSAKKSPFLMRGELPFATGLHRGRAFVSVRGGPHPHLHWSDCSPLVPILGKVSGS